MEPYKTHNHRITRGFLPYVNLDVKDSLLVMIVLLGGMYGGSAVLPVVDWLGYLLGCLPGIALYFYLRFFSLGKPPGHAIDTIEGMVIGRWVSKNPKQKLFDQ